MRVGVWVLSVVMTASVHAQSVPPRFELDYEAMAKKIIERLDMKQGETFLAVAHPGNFDELIPYLRYQAMRIGAVDLGVLDVLEQPVPEGWSDAVLLDGGKAARAPTVCQRLGGSQFAKCD